jgi:IS30 family transposase
MSQYTQLTQDKRYQIYAFMKADFSQTDISSEIGVHKSTISRELKRNRGQKGYRPKQAHTMAVERRRQADKFVKMTPQVISMIEHHIRRDFSPEQASGFLMRKHNIQISHERIYKHVLTDKETGGNLYRHLRHANKKRKKRYGAHDRRGQIRGRVSIDDRPAIVEMKSKFTLIRKIPKKRADLVAEASIDLLNPYKEKVLTITADNGQEFAHHERIKEHLKTDVYFAHPYHSWERGLNENTNGLIRQYFPKGMSFETIQEQHVQMAMDRLNNRPRKTLGYKTPNEVFSQTVTKHAA